METQTEKDKMMDGLHELNTRVKYLEDLVNAMARKQHEFESVQSDFSHKYIEVLQMIATLQETVNHHLLNRP